MIDLFAWGTPIERERRTRIRLTVWAYAYEILSAPLATDAEFDTLAATSNVDILTGRLDDWWYDNFTPYSGAWIHQHPELDRVAALVQSIRARNADR